MRKYICITYHMAKLDGETAETCIDLPMDEKIADDILRAQRDSRYVKDAAWPIASILQNLAKLQGYDVLTLSPAIWKSINEQAAVTV